MYREQPYTGADLASKVLCLTYDDGPGNNTCEIAEFLHDQNIQATFFVIGKYAFHHQDILEKLTNLGHLVGNHTYEHPDLPYHLSISGDIQNQIIRTDNVIKKYAGNTVYFRSPYGKWSKEVANELNLNLLSTVNHIGPIFWDIGGVDCYYWQKGRSVEDTVHKYLEEIKEKDHGIVVMHDEIGDMEYLKERNSTLELTKQLIPLLKQRGYSFVRLDEIPSIKKDVSGLFRFTLKSNHAKFVCIEENANNIVNVNGKKNHFLNQLSMVDLGHGKIALRASNGLFFSLQPSKGNVIEATGREVNKYEEFDLIPVSSNRLLIRAYNGHYLTNETKNGGKLLATAAYMRGAETFLFSPIDVRTKRKISLGEQVKTLKRQILYVKSKIQERSA